MSSFHDWYEQMPDPSLDETTADSLLLGKVPPADAPPGYAGLAALARHVTMAAGAPELAGESTVVESMVAASASADPQRMPIMRKALLAKNLLTAKVAAIAVVGTFGLGSAAAAAAGVLPGQSHSDTRPLRAPISSVTHADGTTTGSTTDGTLPTNGAGALFTPVTTPEEDTTPTSEVTVPEGTTEPTDPTTQPSEDTPGTTEVTNPEDNGADNNQQDQPAVSTPPTTETETTDPQEAQSPEAQSPETQTSPTTEPSETESTTPSTSPTTEQPSTGSDGEQSSATTASPTTAPGSDG